jgi:hypothetical protein
MDNIISDSDAKDLKASIQVQKKTWRHTRHASPEAAVSYANTDPAQGAGEAVFSNNPDGSVSVYWFA